MNRTSITNWPLPSPPECIPFILVYFFSFFTAPYFSIVDGVWNETVEVFLGNKGGWKGWNWSDIHIQILYHYPITNRLLHLPVLVDLANLTLPSQIWAAKYLQKWIPSDSASFRVRIVLIRNDKLVVGASEATFCLKYLNINPAPLNTFAKLLGPVRTVYSSTALAREHWRVAFDDDARRRIQSF